MTDDVLLTLSLLLMGALLARFIASLIRIPEILVLVAFGAAFGPFALDVVDVPFDSLGAQLMFTLGVSLILFYGGLSLSVPVLRKVWVSLAMLAVPGVVLTAAVVGVTAHFAFDLPWDMALLVGRGPRAYGPGDPDPAVHPLAPEAQGGPDRDRGVRLQRPDRGRPRAHARRRGAHGERLGHGSRPASSSSTSGSAP